MADGRTYRTLTIQMMAAICAALILAFLVTLGVYFTGMSFVQQFYFSEEAVTGRMTQEIRSFREYVAENSVASTDVTAVGQWNREHPYTQLTIKGMGTTISSNYYGAELMGTESGLLVQSGTVASDAREFAVNFSDGSYSVVLYESSETLIREVVQFGSPLVGCLVFFLVMLLYDQRVAHAVQTLSRQVRQVSQGELDMKIQSSRRDELGQLARDVDTMRLSIIEKLQREEAALQANSKLLTAISHDVRTPLTALMGYLELMDDEDIPLEERKGYVQVCKNNALRLKGLTDELFGFFLVFGETDITQKIEEFDAAMLMEQILFEQEMTLSQRGFDVRSVGTAPTGHLRLDLSHIRRVFDNLFSNVIKYADREAPVAILRETENGRFHVTISNSIPAHQTRVESNRIGLQTCQKLVQTMGGEFRKSQTADSFTAEVILPLYE